MSEGTGRFDWIIRLSRVAMIATLFVLALAFALTAAKLVITIDQYKGDWQQFAPWALALLGEIALAVIACSHYGLARLLGSAEAGVDSVVARLSRMETLMDDVSGSAKKLVDLSSLSDQAKSLIYREREIDAMREIIQEDLIRQDYRSAEALIESLALKGGYTDEAVRLRKEVEDSRKATLDEKIDTAIGRITEIIGHHDWARALRETQRILRLFPDNPKVASLPERIETERARHKRELLQQYGEAVRKNDIDTSIDLLRALDRYLSPQEAAALEESARGVFRAKLHNLGVQFAICVTDRNWSRAVATGEEIIRDYPNTRMAQEVRMKMDQLRTRAATGEG